MSVKLFKWFLNENVYFFLNILIDIDYYFMKNYKAICIKIVLISQR